MAYKRNLREIIRHVPLYWLLTNSLSHKAEFGGQIVLASQGCQAQRSLGSLARSQKPPFVCRVHDFNQKTTPLYFLTHYPELFSTASIFKTSLPSPYSSSAWVESMSLMPLASEDCFLNHYHIWQYFLLGQVSLLLFQLETEVTYGTESLGIGNMMNVLFVLIVPGLYFRNAPNSLPCWKLWVTNTQQQKLSCKLVAGFYSPVVLVTLISHMASSYICIEFVSFNS